MRCGPGGWRGAIAALAVPFALCAIAPATLTAATRPACFGAAALSAAKPCTNPKLKTMVMPTPNDALLEANAPCTPVEAPVSACSFGVAPGKATTNMALVGDSHAAHWRAGLRVAAQRFRWSVTALTMGSCPFTLGVSVAPEPKRTQCVDWNDGVLRWFRAHPEVSTMVISSHPGYVVRAPGQSSMEAWVAGITAGWAALPATVKHIIVIRDVPFIDPDTLPCVERAMAERKDAGRACALPVKRALHRDPGVVAARELRSPRVQVVDMTSSFCDARLCYPVVGGALVFFDELAHLTRAFGTTLGPFLGDKIRQSMASW